MRALRSLSGERRASAMFFKAVEDYSSLVSTWFPSWLQWGRLQR